jgi:hypothetical protein
MRGVVLRGGHFVSGVDGEGGEVGQGQYGIHKLDLVVFLVDVPPESPHAYVQ